LPHCCQLSSDFFSRSAVIFSISEHFFKQAIEEVTLMVDFCVSALRVAVANAVSSSEEEHVVDNLKEIANFFGELLFDEFGRDVL
jgi:hypothetical protein